MSLSNKSRRNHSKNILIITAICAVLAVLSFALWRSNNTPSTNTNDTSSKDTPDVTKDNIPKATTSDDVDITKSTESIPVSSSSSVAIDSLLQNGEQVTYTATIQGTGGGTCSLLFTSPLGKPVTSTSQAQNNRCEGSIAAVEFDSLGTWTLTLRYYVNQTQAVATKDVTIK